MPTLARTVARPTTFRLAALLIEIDDQKYRVERLGSMYLGFTKIDGTEWPASYRVCPKLHECNCRARQRCNRPCKHLRAIDRLKLEQVLPAAKLTEERA